MGWGTGNLGGGSGGGLNFKVVGNPKPANPKENTIWLNTDVDITGKYFQAEQPEEMVEGEVWISTGTASQVAFNALKKSTIMVYPLSAKQYVSGAWVDVTAMSYQGGEWVDWILLLYDSGTFYGTSVTKNGGNATAKIGNDSIDFDSSDENDSYYYIGFKCDLTTWKTLELTLSSASGGYAGMFVSNTDDPNYLSLYDGRDTVAWKRNCVSGINSLDISSISGIKHVWFGVYGNGTLTTCTVTKFNVR